MGDGVWLWLGRDQVCDALPDSLTVPKKLHSHMAVFNPANDRDFYFQRGGVLCHSNL